MKILNLNTHPDKLFFGESGHGVARYDVVRYPVFNKLNKHMRSLFWEPETVPMAQERRSFQSMTDAEQFVFTENLKRPIIMDTIQGRAPCLLFGRHCTDPALENCITTWQFFESIHSESYTHILRSVYPDPSVVVDDIPNVLAIQQCATSISKAYDALDMSPSKENLYLALVAANALEAIRFQVTFAFNFNFKERTLVSGSGDVFKLIARDETQHLALTQHILRLLPRDDPEFVEIIGDNRERALSIYQTAVDEEKQWSEYSFSKGPILGLTDGVMCSYIDHLHTKQLKALGLSHTNPGPTPLRFIGKYLGDADSVQAAPQEDGALAYKSASSLSNDLSDFVPDF